MCNNRSIKGHNSENFSSIKIWRWCKAFKTKWVSRKHLTFHFLPFWAIGWAAWCPKFFLQHCFGCSYLSCKYCSLTNQCKKDKKLLKTTLASRRSNTQSTISLNVESVTKVVDTLTLFSKLFQNCKRTIQLLNINYLNY